MKTKGKLVVFIMALLGLTTLIWAAVALQPRIATWIHPLKPVRVEFFLAETAPGTDLVEKEFGGIKYYLHPSAVTNRDMAKVSGALDGFGKPSLSFVMTKEGAGKMSTLTGQNIRKHIAMSIDGRIVAVARIQSRISKHGQLTGNFTRKELDDLVKELNGQ